MHDLYLFTYLYLFLVTYNCIKISLNCISKIYRNLCFRTTGTFQLHYWLNKVSRALFQNKFQQACTDCQLPEALKVNATMSGREFLCTVPYLQLLQHLSGLNRSFFIPPTDLSYIATYKYTGKFLWRFAVLSMVVRNFLENYVCQRGQDLSL